MSNLREVKSRISSTLKTSQITNAMNMVSASKLRRAEKKFTSYNEYMSVINNLVFNVIKPDMQHPLLEKREVKKVCYIIITSDKGLAGAYNNNVVKKLEAEINGLDNAYVGVIGKHGLDFCKKNNYKLVYDKSISIRDDVLFIDLEDISNKIINMFLNKEVDEINIIYNKYINTLTQEVVLEKFLPLEIKNLEDNLNDYIFEEGMDNTIDLLIPMYLKNKLYGYVLNAKTSEHSARMNSMKSATDNAKEVIDKLQILYNRARQDSITKELTDIVSGANSI